MKLRKYTKDDLEHAVATSCSLRQVLDKLGVVPAGGNYQTLKKAITTFKMDSSHFTGQGHLKGKQHTYRVRPLDIILVKSKIENTYQLKNRLIKDEVKSHICEQCELTQWLESKIPLELHHKDGDRTNNVLSNLQLLCPNCHALTDNYRGKNKIKRQ